MSRRIPCPVFTLIISLVTSSIYLLMPASAHCLEPDEVLVVVNDRMTSSLDLGRYYMKQRGIPDINLVRLATSTDEQIQRKVYDTEIKFKIKQKLHELQLKTQLLQKPRIAAIVLIFGVPLKILPPEPSASSSRKILKIKKKIARLLVDENFDKKEKELKILKKQLENLRLTKSRASVDSELMMVKLEKYELNGWIANPYFLGNQGRELPYSKDDVLLVSRLDGPHPEIVFGIINDTLAVEKSGLVGRGYFDARGLVKDKKDTKALESGYARYDYSIRLAAKSVEKRLAVTINNESGLFPERSCPDAVLYCGWYSLAKYIDSFTWKRGAIGYHIASAECATLRNRKKPVWCIRMLEKGVAATLGPVFEPYVQGFPLPEVFFHKLIEGYMSLGEAYLVSLPFTSWQMVLVGDPLYQPFRPE